MSFRVPPCHLLHVSRTAPTRYSSCSRAFSSTRSVAAEVESEDADPPSDDNAEGDEAPMQMGRSGADVKYTEWLMTRGEQWRRPDSLGPNWLGGSVPFPRNPTFRPPTPASDALRTSIYSSFVKNPEANDVRTLSTRYGIAIKRIEAIIRLKELEEQWKKSKPLQTGFLKSMEQMLGLNVGGQKTPLAEELQSESRQLVADSDEISRQTSETGQEKKRGIGRTFFEPVDEGEEPLVSRLLDVEREKARRTVTDPSTYPTVVVQPDSSKPPIKFVDVGLRWVNPRDLERRAKESVRRKMVKGSQKRTVGNQSDGPAA